MQILSGRAELEFHLNGAGHIHTVMFKLYDKRNVLSINSENFFTLFF